jgi:hypothetical protein
MRKSSARAKVTIMPIDVHVGIGVALKGESVLASGRPHVVKVSAEHVRDGVDGLPDAGNDGIHVRIHGVELVLGPAQGVKKGGRCTGLVTEGGSASSNHLTGVILVGHF